MRREKREQLKQAVLLLSDFCNSVPDCEDCLFYNPDGAYCCRLIERPLNWQYEDLDKILRLGEEDER